MNKLACLAGTIMLAFAGPAAAQVSGDDRADLLALEARWNEAIVSQDIGALEEILDQNFLFVAGDGSESNREELLAFVRDRRVTVDPFETERVVVRIFGNSAVVTGAFTQTIRLGERSQTARYRYTDVYIRDAAGEPWRAVSAHATIFPEPAA